MGQQRSRWGKLVFLLTLSFAALAGCGGGGAGGGTPIIPQPPGELELVFMAGTQPDEAGTFQFPSTCSSCHSTSPLYTDVVAPYNEWLGSMMGNSARDPLFWALLAVEGKAFEKLGVGIGDFCLRCHVPTGWLEGRSEPTDGSAFMGNDFSGVQCDLCHRMVDPLTAEGIGMVNAANPVTDYRSGQFVVSDNALIKRGPFDNSVSPNHQTAYSDFHTRGDICGTCHDISNPYYDQTVPVERTYSEWKNSGYPGMGTTCQTCHMPATISGYASQIRNIFRNNIAEHEFVGGNYWAPLAIIEFDDTLTAEQEAALQAASNLAVQQLQSAAQLSVAKGTGTIEVTVTNLTGHKLPTGYPEGRRMWINVQFKDGGGSVVSESGAYDAATGVLTEDDALKLYEAKPGMLNVPGYPDGPSFHFALNNHIFKDNRIPPQGFTNAAFESAKAYIRGATYADGQNWDKTAYTVPAGAVSADVTLYYQSTSKEFVQYLRDANAGNKFDIKGAGQKVYDIWVATGKAAPVAMETATISGL